MKISGAAGRTRRARGNVSVADAVLAELARLTPRDRVLLRLLHAHLTFTTEQIAGMGFGSLGRARNRLAALHERGVLDRFRHYERYGSQSFRWTLGPVGAAIIAGEQERPAPRPAALRNSMSALAMSPTLPHRLAVNGFFAALLAYARHKPDVRLERWWNEAACRKAINEYARPDGHGLWRHGERLVPFWLEVDRGTETLRRVTDKLAGYRRLTYSDVNWPVLFWLPTPKREANLRALLARTTLPPSLVVATSAPDYGNPAGPVWHRPDQPVPVTLADLPSPMTAAALRRPDPDE